MHRMRHIVSGLAVSAMLFGGSLAAFAQSTPGTDAEDPRAQLAAVTPGVEDLPTGYTFVGETFLTVDQVAASGIDAGALADAGFVTQYVSVYENPDTDERLRSYVSLWNDDAAAESGFAILEDEASTDPDATLEDSGTDVGEDPRETTTGTYTDNTGATVGTVDVTFRRGPMVIGVAHEKLDGSAADASIATDLAGRVDSRAQSVLNGESPEHTDLTLPSSALSFASEGNAVAQAGFLGPVEVESIYGVQGSLLSGVDASWVETALIGTTDPNGPIVTIGVTTFVSEQDARFVVDQASDLFVPLDNQESVEGAAVEGSDAAVAFRYTSAGIDGDALDSYRLIFSTGATLTVVDVQGAASDGGAETAASTVAAAQVDCQTGGSCDAPTLPGEFTGQ